MYFNPDSGSFYTYPPPILRDLVKNLTVYYWEALPKSGYHILPDTLRILNLGPIFPADYPSHFALILVMEFAISHLVNLQELRVVVNEAVSPSDIPSFMDYLSNLKIFQLHCWRTREDQRGFSSANFTELFVKLKTAEELRLDRHLSDRQKELLFSPDVTEFDPEHYLLWINLKCPLTVPPLLLTASPPLPLTVPPVLLTVLPPSHALLTFHERD
ncbi:hypothetical protein M422DRAFT_42969 [Sphaerobolus stellatus SS14]|nr:hypothetical protein M422DRAFT_42969 [Sphaerobolus stellatus SS14]